MRREMLLPLFFLGFFSCHRLIAGCLLENGMSSVYLSVFEDAAPGSVLGKLPLKRPADGEELSLRVVKGNDLIEVDQQSKVLTLTQQLDRDEGNSKFEAVIECKSSNSESDFGQLNISVFVTVKDVNDNAPEFDEDQYNVTISEELPVGTIVFTDFEATDRDQPGPNSFVQYSIVPSKYSALLEIQDPFKAAISIKSRIDYEKIKEFAVEIEARDQGEPSQSSRVPLHVTVIDSNDLNPVFRHSFYSASRVKNGELVLEPEAIAALDGDSLKAEMIYSLDGELSEQFSVDARGIIRVRSDPPPLRATLIVRAHEKDHPERNATAVIRVDFGPKLHFRHRTYSAKVPASLPVGSPLFIVEALSDKGAKVRYSLSGDGSLGIDAKSGEVSVRGPLQAGEHSWNVTATASGESISTPLTLLVDKVPEAHKLEFEKSEYQLQIGSLPILGTIRLRGESKATFKLMNMNREFLIDPSGIVRLKPGAKPSCSTCELVVVATDEEGGSSIARIIIKNNAYTQEMSYSTVLVIVALFALFGIVILIIVFLLKQVKSAPVAGPNRGQKNQKERVNMWWRARRRSNICWMNTSNDTGVTITGTLPTPSRYVVNSGEKAYESAKSPAPKRAQGAQLVPVTVSQDGGPPTVYF